MTDAADDGYERGRELQLMNTGFQVSVTVDHSVPSN
jgi:hypothetical protein